MPQNTTMTVSRNATVYRTCSACYHHWQHTEQLTASETKGSDFSTPQFDQGKLNAELDRKTKAYQTDNSKFATCPKCGALSNECVWEYFSRGFVAGLSDVYWKGRSEQYPAIFGYLIVACFGIGTIYLNSFTDWNHDLHAVLLMFSWVIGIGCAVVGLFLFFRALYRLTYILCLKSFFVNKVSTLSEKDGHLILSQAVKSNCGEVDMEHIVVPLLKSMRLIVEKNEGLPAK